MVCVFSMQMALGLLTEVQGLPEASADPAPSHWYCGGGCGGCAPSRLLDAVDAAGSAVSGVASGSSVAWNVMDCFARPPFLETFWYSQQGMVKCPDGAGVRGKCRVPGDHSIL